MIVSIRSARSAGVRSARSADRAEGHGEQVAGIVGKAVQDEIGPAAAMENERGAVVAERRQFGEKPAVLRTIAALRYSSSASTNEAVALEQPVTLGWGRAMSKRDWPGLIGRFWQAGDRAILRRARDLTSVGRRQHP